MTVLRVLNLLVWGGLFLYMLPAAATAIRARHSRHGDPMRLGVALMAMIICGFVGRSLWAPNHQASWGALYVLCAVNGVYIGYLAKAYGRGPRK